MTTIYENIDDLIELSRRKIEKLQELKRVLRIADLVGIPPKELKERVSVSYRDTGCGGSYNPKPWIHMILTVRVGDGPYEDYPLHTVHQDLWPHEMVTAYENWSRRTRRNHPTPRGMQTKEN